MDEIRLTYGRVGDLYSGSIQVQYHATRGLLSQDEFEGVSFPRMMSKLAGVIREHKEVVVILFRTEVTGSSCRLDPQTVEGLRTDPAAAISSMMPEARTVVIREAPASVIPPSGLLRAGHDTIAEAFGDSLYCVANLGGRVECPACGRWSEASSLRLLCANTECSIRLAGKMTGRSWFVVRTQALLELKKERYFLPRSWNPSHGWISHADLQATFDNFQKEREQCFKVTSPEE